MNAIVSGALNCKGNTHMNMTKPMLMKNSRQNIVPCLDSLAQAYSTSRNTKP